jgi:uncharacterized protein (TIGR02246 family)
MNSNKWLSGILVMALWALPAVADEATDRNTQQDAQAVIEQRAESYAAAFNAKDLDALIGHWTPDGVYIDRASGQQIVGRDALRKAFQDELAASKQSRLQIEVGAVDMISPGVAVERGTSTITNHKGESAATQYNAVHVKRDGQWLIDRISESEIIEPPSHYEQLKELEWMIGDWTDQDGEGIVTTECQWARNNNFVVRSFTVSIADELDMAGMQLIGWDPAKKQIRSWTFDSDGGFNHGVWKKSADRWSVQQLATLPDGTLASSTSLLTPIDDQTFTWQQVNRIVGGQLLPNLPETVIRRK